MEITEQITILFSSRLQNMFYPNALTLCLTFVFLILFSFTLFNQIGWLPVNMPCTCAMQVLQEDVMDHTKHLHGCELKKVILKNTSENGDHQNGHHQHHPHRKTYDDDDEVYFMDDNQDELRDIVRLFLFILLLILNHNM